MSLFTGEEFPGKIKNFLVANNFTEAVVTLTDGSRICFKHTPKERWVKTLGILDESTEHGLAGALVSQIKMFRLNSKHLVVDFLDGSVWDQKITQA